MMVMAFMKHYNKEKSSISKASARFKRYDKNKKCIYTWQFSDQSRKKLSNQNDQGIGISKHGGSILSGGHRKLHGVLNINND